VRVRVLTLCCLVGLALLPAEVFACSCANVSEEEHRAGGDLIFVGTVVRVQETATLFSVEKTVKGQSYKELVVYTPEPSNSCRTQFTEGATYLVSAKLGSGEPYTNYCSGNKLIRSVKENQALSNPVDNAQPASTSPGARRGGVTYKVAAGVLLCLITALGVGAWVLLKRSAA
jgi:hypothetical protein